MSHFSDIAEKVGSNSFIRFSRPPSGLIITFSGTGKFMHIYVNKIEDFYIA